MTRAAASLLITLSLFLACLPGVAGGAEQRALHYRLQVRIDPGLHRIEGEARIQNPPTSRFYLYKGMSVRAVLADGKRVPFHSDASAPPLPYAPAAVAVAVDVDAKGIQQLQVNYGGEIGEVVLGVNTIAPDLVELALYTAWFPTYEGFKLFTFDLEANLPQGFVVISNGQEASHRENAGRAIASWTSRVPGMDIVLLASPHLERRALETPVAAVEIYHSRLPEEVVKPKIDALVAAMEKVTSLYGAPQTKAKLCLVYSPRPGWGYSRIPLIVVSEERARGVLSGPNGEANDFRDNAHEMAHFWWAIADMATPDDWINEGLAEFTAFRVTTEQFGEAFAAARLAEYQQQVRNNKTTSAIAETSASSPDREINRYYRTTLMFLEARRRFGEESLDKLLRTFYAPFAGTDRATTASFLECVNQQLGKEADVFFRDELYRRPTLAAGQQNPAPAD